MLGFKSHSHRQMERDRTADTLTHGLGHAHLSAYTHMHIRCFVGACQPVLCESWVRVELMTQEILSARVLQFLVPVVLRDDNLLRDEVVLQIETKGFDFKIQTPFTP